MTPGSETVAPRTSTMTKVFYATTKTGEKTQIGYIQSVAEFLKAPEPITYSALDIPDERMAKGKVKAETIEIPFLYTESQWDELRAVETAGTEVYVFLQLPNDTANTANKPVTFNFKSTLAVGMNQIEIDNMLQSKVTLYRSSAIEESKGFPTE
ncbi:MAG: hypothetical protein IJ690_01615 [Clostridia bacterium]|nr:hypothetical protein [Clostridia bacterium]MBR1653640.1 hypothetical protein [Clostridia bacterium]